MTHDQTAIDAAIAAIGAMPAFPDHPHLGKVDDGNGGDLRDETLDQWMERTSIAAHWPDLKRRAAEAAVRAVLASP